MMPNLTLHNSKSKSLRGQFCADFRGHSFVERAARTHNSTYPKGRVTCSKDSFLVNGSLLFQIKFCGKSPALR